MAAISFTGYGTGTGPIRKTYAKQTCHPRNINDIQISRNIGQLIPVHRDRIGAAVRANAIKFRAHSVT